MNGFCLPRRRLLAAAVCAGLAGPGPGLGQAVVSLGSLAPPRGFTVVGDVTGDELGLRIAGAGDVNGDGLDDVIVAARPGSSVVAHVIFGTPSPPAMLSPSSLSGSNGFSITGATASAVAAAGDINGDGFSDVVVTSSGANSQNGRAFVVFGSDQPFAASINVGTLDGSNGFALEGYDGRFGSAASAAGDFNGDGIDDVLISAPYELVRRRVGINVFDYPQAGKSYLIFGTDQGFAPSFDVTDLDGDNGFVLLGAANFDRTGKKVSGAGDFNGDGLDDIVIGSEAERAFVVFGRPGNGVAGIRLGDLDGSDGFAIAGSAVGDLMGQRVGGAGDLNADGLGDVVIGASNTDAGNEQSVGKAYVLLGDNQSRPPVFDVANLAGSNGFTVGGIDEYDFMGNGVAGSGDVNGDGIDDLLLGASGVTPPGFSAPGATYVLFGSQNGFPVSVDIGALNGQNGTTIPGLNDFSYVGAEVVTAGDFDGDGLDDMIVRDHYSGAGQAYVVFGNSAPRVTASTRVLPGAVDGAFLPEVAVAELGALTADPDGLSGLAVVGQASTAGQGQWEYRLNAISAWQVVPAGINDGNALVLSALGALRFVPEPGFRGRSSALSVRLWDGFLFNGTGTGRNIVAAIDGFGGFADDANLLQLVADVSDELFKDGFEP